jgi:flagellar hook-associated protein 1 FlgK
MSLTGALNIGKSALAAQQAAIQVTGNNIANAGSADFTRQTASLAPSRDKQYAPGVFIGTGVNLGGVRRQIDEALQSRLRGSVSDNEGASVAEQWLSRVEATFNELGDDDLSTRMSTFFGSWSNLANKPQDAGLRQVVLQSGETLAKGFTDLRGHLGGLQTEADDRLRGFVKDADGLASQIAKLNGQIVVAEGGAGPANGLRDQRDAVLKQLAQLVDVRTVAQDNGVVNVHLGSEPLVLGADSRGLSLRQDVTGTGPDATVTTSVVFKSNGGKPALSSGQIAGLLAARTKIDEVVGQIDGLAKNLIFEMNKLHASGQGLEGFASATAANPVADPALALNDPATGLASAPANGSFVVHVKDKASGRTTSTLVQIDLDGRDGDDTTLNSLRSDLAGVPGVAATIAGGKLKIAAASAGSEISFSQDSSGALAALGVNGFYTGRDARDIAVSSVLRGQPNRLAAAKNGEKGDNQTARAIAGLESKPLGAQGGMSLKDSYQSAVSALAGAASGAKTEVEATRVVKETLESQREALSGVSLDEEAINLMRQQRAFQGAARLVAAVDELMQTVLRMV